jgi:hypothetical protein
LNEINPPTTAPAKLNEKEKSSIKATDAAMKGADGKTLVSLDKTSANGKNYTDMYAAVKTAKEIEAEEDAIRYDRWKMVYPYYNIAKNYLEAIYSYLNPLKNCFIRLSFRSLVELRHKIAIFYSDYSNYIASIGTNGSDPANSGGNSGNRRGVKGENDVDIFYTIYRLFTDEMIFEKGHVARLFKAFQEDYLSELGTLFGNLKDYLEVSYILTVSLFTQLLIVFSVCRNENETTMPNA